MKDKITLNDEKEINNNVYLFEKRNCMKEYKLRALQNFALKLDIQIKGLKKEDLCKEIVKRLKKSKINKNLVEDNRLLIENEKLVLNEKINNLKLKEWDLPNKSTFIDFILEEFQTSLEDFEKKSKTLDEVNNYNLLNLFDHQKYITEYIQEDSPYRGLLLYHGLGSGKTASSISIVEGFNNKEVVIMLPSSLESNYKKEIYKYGDISYKKYFFWVKVELNEIIKNELMLKGFDEKFLNYIKNNNSIWLISKNSNYHKSNFNSLSINEQKSVEKQIERIIEYKYKFIHYNGGNSVYKHIYNLLSEDIKNNIISKLKINKDDNISKKVLNYIFNNNQENNPFNNKIIVVDEVHNLISTIINGSQISGIIYKLLISAINCRIIFLSGTPVINNPFELAIMFNLLRGYNKIYRFKLNTIKNVDQLYKILSKEKLVDRIIIESNYFDITRLPYNFIFDNNRKYIIKQKSENNIENNTCDDKQFIKYISNLLLENKYQKKDVEIIYNNTIFPDIINENEITNKSIIEAIENFNKIYVDNDKIKNNSFFVKRILGLISYYNEITDKDPKVRKELFPSQKINTDGEVYFSDYQFIQYVKDRFDEIEFDKLNEKRKSNDPDGDIFSFFRIFSRQSSNFVFPPEIERIRKSDFKNNYSYKKSYLNLRNEIFKINKELKKIQKEVKNKDLNKKEKDIKLNKINEIKLIIKKKSLERDELKMKLDNEESYENEIKKLLPQLTKENLTINDSTYNLKVLSPKYAKILENIYSSPGLILCYSQFRNVEGIGVFTKILDYNGFERFTNNTNNLSIGSTVRVKIGDKYNTNIIKDIKEDKYYLENDNKVYNKEQLFKAKYILYTGTENENERKLMLEEFNKKENRYGKNILIILITESGAEGLSLFNVRQVHILEPYWNKVRTDQIKGRARRIKSHINLKEDEQNVEIFEYKTIFTENQLVNKLDVNLDKPKNLSDMIYEINMKDKNISTDESLYNLSLKKTYLINQFLDLVKESAIDCQYNYEDNILSDPNLENIECIDKIDSKGIYAYDIGNKDKPFYNVDTEEELLELIKKNRKKLKLLTRKINNVQLRFIVELSNKKNKKIYDFYSFYNLYPNIDFNIGEKISLGTINNNKLDINIDDKFTFMKLIEESISILDLKIPDDNSKNEYYEEFSNKIKKYTNDILNKKWICPFCKKYNNVYENKCSTLLCNGSLLFYIELEKAYKFANDNNLN